MRDEYGLFSDRFDVIAANVCPEFLAWLDIQPSKGTSLLDILYGGERHFPVIRLVAASSNRRLPCMTAVTSMCAGSIR